MSDWKARAHAAELRDLLDRTGLSRSEFCRRMDIDPGTLSRWLNGKTVPPRCAIAYLRVIVRLMQVLELEGVKGYVKPADADS